MPTRIFASRLVTLASIAWVVLAGTAYADLITYAYAGHMTTRFVRPSGEVQVEIGDRSGGPLITT